jgi:hypothetical protein
MSGDRTEVSENMQQVIVFCCELEGVVHEKFCGFFNPKPQNVEGLPE